jgi:hypothetical protein
VLPLPLAVLFPPKAEAPVADARLCCPKAELFTPLAVLAFPTAVLAFPLAVLRPP